MVHSPNQPFVYIRTKANLINLREQDRFVFKDARFGEVRTVPEIDPVLVLPGAVFTDAGKEAVATVIRVFINWLLKVFN